MDGNLASGWITRNRIIRSVEFGKKSKARHMRRIWMFRRKGKINSSLTKMESDHASFSVEANRTRWEAKKITLPKTIVAFYSCVDGTEIKDTN